MKNKKIKEGLKATIFWIIVAFLIVIMISLLAIKFGKEKFLKVTDLISLITIDTNSQAERPLPELQWFEKEYLENEITVLMNCPAYGDQYATLKIPSIGVELPIYYGKTMDLLKNGVGHDEASYFPGEGGSVILMGHNYKRLLGKLPEAKVGEAIQIITNYGEFDYMIYDTKIVNETATNQVPIQAEDEKLMIYTCWPINNIGYATERYVVYAEKVGEEK